MFNSNTFSLAWHHLNRTMRVCLTVFMLLCILFAVLVLSIRYWFLPNIESYRGLIERSAAQSLGAAVSIGRIEGEWQGLRPRLDFFDVRVLDAQKQTALILPEIHNILSWTSLFTFKLRLHTLEISRAELLVQRTTDGKILIGGLSVFDQQQQGADDWILHQPRVIVRDAKLIWWDQQRNAMPLVVNDFDLRIRNFFSHHQVAISIKPAQRSLGQIQLKADLRGKSLNELSQWQGEIFTQLDYVDVAALAAWVDLPAELRAGHGGLRAWLEVLDGQPVSVITDVDLAGVHTRLDANSPDLVIKKLYGRLSWEQGKRVNEFATRDVLLELADGAIFMPLNLSFRQESGVKSLSTLKINQIDLAPLTAFAQYAPVPQKLKEHLFALQARGVVKQLMLRWSGQGGDFRDYQYDAQLENIATRRVGDIPGFTGVNAVISGKDGEGQAELSSNQFMIDATPMMREALVADELSGQLHWQNQAGEWAFVLSKVKVRNADLSGQAEASYRTLAGTDGFLSLDIRLDRADVRRVARYIPVLVLEQAGSDWLNNALQAGLSNDVRVLVEGNLTDFENGAYEKTKVDVSASAKGAILAFDSAWPTIGEINGRLSIKGMKLEVFADSATMAGAQLKKVLVQLPDMAREDLPLVINGQAIANAHTFMDFIQHSPVRGYIDGATDDMRAKGDAALDLALYIPLYDPVPGQKIVGYKPLKVDGKVVLNNASVQVTSSLPNLSQVNGVLKFNERDFTTEGIRGNWLDGPIQVTVLTKPDGSAEANLAGHTPFHQLRRLFAFPLSQHLVGEVDWTGNLLVQKQDMKLVVQSNLKGLKSNFPAPFSKQPDSVLPFQLTYQYKQNSPIKVNAKVGSLLGLQVLMSPDEAVKQIVLNFSDQADYPQKEGLWLVGKLPEIFLPDWVDLLETELSKEQSGLGFSGVDLQIDALNGYYLAAKKLSLTAQASKRGIRADVSGQGLSGSLEWQEAAGGKLDLNLKELNLRKGGGLGLATPNQPSMTPTQLPSLSVTVDKLSYMDKSLGSLVLVGRPEQDSWHLQKLKLENADAVLTGSGEWTGNKQQAKTSLQLQLDGRDMGQLLARLGYPDQLKASQGNMSVNAYWNGSPQMFSLARMNGDLKLDTTTGQFLQMQPGMGKLLSVFSLQALPKRLVLDFRDVFSAGFQFDSIRAEAQIKQGMMSLGQVNIDGSAAKVVMTGEVNLLKETQQLKVKVIPTIGNSVSLIGAFVVNPVVGVGTLVLNKVLGNPLDKMAAFEYNISGSWEDPIIEKNKKTITPPVSQQNNLLNHD